MSDLRILCLGGAVGLASMMAAGYSPHLPGLAILSQNIGEPITAADRARAKEQPDDCCDNLPAGVTSCKCGPVIAACRKGGSR